MTLAQRQDNKPDPKIELDDSGPNADANPEKGPETPPQEKEEQVRHITGFKVGEHWTLRRWSLVDGQGTNGVFAVMNSGFSSSLVR